MDLRVNFEFEEIIISNSENKFYFSSQRICLYTFLDVLHTSKRHNIQNLKTIQGNRPLNWNRKRNGMEIDKARALYDRPRVNLINGLQVTDNRNNFYVHKHRMKGRKINQYIDKLLCKVECKILLIIEI